MEQLGMFNDTYKNGKKELETIDYQIGIYKDIAHIKGVNELTDKGLELLNYLYQHHSREEDGFIHASDLAKELKIYDTREIRKICAEIDLKTELVIYASQDGYKLVASEREMERAIKFALAPAMTSIRRVFAKNKKETLHWLHGFLGNLEKEFGGIAQGQQQYDDEKGEMREVNHYPDAPFISEYKSVKQRLDEE